MQEENKVELDTDDVKEEDVSIEEKPKTYNIYGEFE